MTIFIHFSPPATWLLRAPRSEAPRGAAAAKPWFGAIYEALKNEI